MLRLHHFCISPIDTCLTNPLGGRGGKTSNELAVCVDCDSRSLKGGMNWSWQMTVTGVPVVSWNATIGFFMSLHEGPVEELF